MKIIRVYPVFQNRIKTKMTQSSSPPTSQVTNGKRKMYVENKGKYSKKRKIQTS